VLHVSCRRVSIYSVKHCGMMHPEYPVEEFSIYRVKHCEMLRSMYPIEELVATE
jgi:hypothetical protein